MRPKIILCDLNSFRCVLCHAGITFGDSVSIDNNDNLLNIGLDVSSVFMARRQNGHDDVNDVAGDDGGDVLVVVQLCWVKLEFEKKSEKLMVTGFYGLF